MRILQLKPFLSTAELSGKLMSCTNAQKRSYWQILLSVSFNPNKKAQEYAQFLGVKTGKVYRVVQQYNKEGAEFTDHVSWGGRRKETAYLTLDQEKKMMDSIRAKAVQGKILTAKDVVSYTKIKSKKVVYFSIILDIQYYFFNFTI